MFSETDTLTELSNGRIEILFIDEKHKSIDILRDLSNKFNTTIKYITDKSDEGMNYIKYYDSIGGILRW